MSDKKYDFLDQVQEQIKAIEAKEMISHELNHHINSEKKRLVQTGVEEEEAERVAIKQMGSPVQLGQRLNKLHRPKTDWWLISLLVVTIGLSFLPLMFWNLDLNYYFERKIIFSVISVMIITGLMFFDYRKLYKWRWFFYLMGLFVLALLVLFPTTYTNGIPVLRVGPFGIDSTQTLLLFYVGFSALFISSKVSYWKFLLLCSVPIFFFLIVLDPNSIFVFSAMTVVLLWFSDVRKKRILLLAVSSLAVMFSAGYLLWGNLDDYQKDRILGYLNPTEYADSSGYMYLQAKELLKAAGWFGQRGEQVFIPTGHTDFVFLSLTYHFGWMLGIILFLVLAMLMTRMIYVTFKINDSFGKMLVVGGLSLFSVQFLYSIAMTLGLLPIIGISLPFISYGLTPTIMNSIVFGNVLSVYRRKNIVFKQSITR
ncbi:FtsW/RodA/SpoVE family cell cycle protein [Bacillus sp. es.036]|uniref:FtsW/RodA/SpoVE family cell cycle protein n=1 Tax=Bacillus sp. es.036 TaxID=1761764 RepID=UPI000BFA7005|nr:FtsW/RodA/SpoVE family cell cycle protein [Bacillus sp. es.036]PFG13507.1 cell division protein FtsW (lipid II flippase) [Bacillus sp. es.036]